MDLNQKVAEYNDFDDKIYKMLFLACDLGDVNDFKKFLENNKLDINIQSKKGITILMIASFNNLPDIVKYIIEQPGVNINLKDENNRNALFYSINHYEIMKILIESRIEMDVIDKIGETVLLKPYLSFEKIKLLINNGAKLNITNSLGETFLHLATAKNYVILVKFLIDSGADLDIPDIQNYTPLLLSIETQLLYPFKLLVDAGSNLEVKNEDGDNALILASSFPRKEFVKYLIEVGKADINTRSIDNETPLIVASGIKNNSHIVKYLINKNADVNIKDNEGKTALIYAVENNCVKNVKLLVEANAYIDIVDEEGENVLIKTKNLEIRKIIIEKKEKIKSIIHKIIDSILIPDITKLVIDLFD
jgi:ankyrin repeat protein